MGRDEPISFRVNLSEGTSVKNIFLSVKETITIFSDQKKEPREGSFRVKEDSI